MYNKMDATHLITHKDTHDTIKSAHMFLIANMVAIVVILLGSVGWMFYSQHAKIWPYKPYVRKAGPHGTEKMSDVIADHPASDPATAEGDDAAATETP